MLSLTVDGLEVRFPGLSMPALDVPSLELTAGTRVAVTGPSGSGKTTLINVLTGLERVRHGKVAWQGTDLAGLSERKRDRWRAVNIGLVMQDFHLFPGLSALENVLLPQRLSHMTLPAGLHDNALRLLQRVGIERLDQSIETMSRGQMQRVAVARALVGKPGLLVADEPTASLDVDAGASVADLLLELTSEVGSTLIVASHDHRLVDRLDRVLRLEGGRIVQG